MTRTESKAEPIPSVATGIAVTSRSELAERLYDLLSMPSWENRELAPELEKLEHRYDASPYSELIYLLSHLRFEPAEAKRHWRSIVEHRGLMEERLGSHVDLRVALASYFVQVNRQLDNPIIIEMRLFDEARASAYRDELTGLRNYRFLSEVLPQEVLRADQYNVPLTLIMIDIDGFKGFNDRLGHEAGNRALATVGRLISDSLREVDFAIRYGGEEFALVAPSTPKVGGRILAERVRRAVEAHSFSGEGGAGPAESLTVSLGVATYPADATSAAELVRVADRAMYHAKASGKNRVQLYGENRRSFRRIGAALNGCFGFYHANDHPLTTVDISEGGIRFTTPHAVERGDLLDLSLRLPKSRRVLSFAGRVVQVREVEGKFEAAVRIIDMQSPDRHLLAQYIRRQPESDPTRDPEPSPPAT